MSRFYPGMIVRTSYGSGPYVITSVSGPCTCPAYLDVLNMRKAPPSRPHYHLVAKEVGKPRSSDYYLNGYDENGNYVWGDARLIVCAEETLLLTMAACM